MLRSLQFQLVSTHGIILALRLSSLILFSSILSGHGHTTRAHIFIYAGCSQEKYQPNSPFEGNLNSFLSSVASSASDVSYNSFVIGNGGSITPQEGSIYGLFQCRGDLSTIDCSKCVASSVNQIGLVCPYALGASLQLEGCCLRYDYVDFLGKLDTSLWYKKCNKDVSNESEFFRSRDAVLADLEAGKNGFRVSSSGLVEGYAQCLGDLAEADCNSCLDEAVVKLKSFCGSAASGDVFLAQCYARYWASGYYDEADSSNDEDQVGKSIAIIVGVIGGVAILVVLLSICHAKSYG